MREIGSLGSLNRLEFLGCYGNSFEDSLGGKFEIMRNDNELIRSLGVLCGYIF